MKRFLVFVVFFVSLVCFKTNAIEPINIGGTSNQYSSELLSAIKQVAILDAVLEKPLFNENSMSLDITLFDYYSNFYKQKKRELSQPVGGGNGHPSQGQISDYEEKLKEDKALWELIFRMNH